MRRPWWFALFLLAAAVFGAYAYTFGPASHWQPSVRTEDWARFGTYVGGLCVPLLVLALFANAAALRRQSESQRRRVLLDELLLEARHLAASIEQLAAAPVEAVATPLSQKLDLLAAVLSEFVSRGGDSIFLLFYRDRFRATAQRLGELQIALSTGEWWLASSEETESRRWRF